LYCGSTMMQEQQKGESKNSLGYMKSYLRSRVSRPESFGVG